MNEITLHQNDLIKIKYFRWTSNAHLMRNHILLITKCAVMRYSRTTGRLIESVGHHDETGPITYNCDFVVMSTGKTFKNYLILPSDFDLVGETCR